MDRETRLVYGGLAAFLLFAWWAHAYHYDLEAAWKGFGPIGYVYQSADPDSFARNYPGGTETYDASAFMQGYKLAHRAGIEPETMVPIVIAFEILLLAAAVVLLLRALRPEASPAVAAVVVVLVVASSARDMSLARFGQPFIIGQFYNFAEVLRVLAIVAILKGRPLASAACLAATFIIHPTLALIGAAFVGGAMLVRPREIVSRRVMAGAFLFAAVCVGGQSASWGSALP